MRERKVCAGVMPLRPVLGFFSPRARSWRTCSTSGAWSSRNPTIPCRRGYRPGIRRYPAGEGRGGRPGFAIRDRRSRVGVRRYGSCFLLRAQELLVQLADALQGGLQVPVVAQPLLDHGFLFGGEAELLGASAGIADG